MPGKPLKSLSENSAFGSRHGSAPGAEHPVGQDLSRGQEEQEEEEQLSHLAEAEGGCGIQAWPPAPAVAELPSLFLSPFPLEAGHQDCF